MEYYWIDGIQAGYPFRHGPYNHDQNGFARAQSDGINWCGSNFEILTLHTKDKNAAKSEIASIKAHRGIPIRDALQRQRFKPNEETSQVYKENNERQYREL